MNPSETEANTILDVCFKMTNTVLSRIKLCFIINLLVCYIVKVILRSRSRTDGLCIPSPSAVLCIHTRLFPNDLEMSTIWCWIGQSLFLNLVEPGLLQAHCQKNAFKSICLASCHLLPYNQLYADIWQNITSYNM